MDEFLPQSQTFILNQIKEFINLGHEIIIIGLISNNRIFDFQNIKIITVKENFWYRLKIKLRKLGYFSYSKIIFKSIIKSIILDEKPDCIIANFGPNGIDINSCNLKIPTVIVLHGYDASQLPKNSVSYRKEMKNIAKKNHIEI
ncbi:MAG TPA: glycosyltransferase, partial [Saprospiraceae bacterium]|nr:glycosyltransferase [Saprospiraceae bacterium]